VLKNESSLLTVYDQLIQIILESSSPSAKSRSKPATSTTGPTSRVRLLSSLSTTEVQTLLENLNMTKFIPKLDENKVNGARLNAVSCVNDLTELGIDVKIKARVFYDELSEFKLSGVPEFLIYSSIKTRNDTANATVAWESKDKPISYEVGMKVEGNYRSRGKWYFGKITRIMDENCYEITYDDGEVEAKIDSSRIRLPLPAATASDLKEGVKVEVNYRGNSTFYPGIIQTIHENSTYDILYDDGERETMVPIERIRLLKKVSPKKSSTHKKSTKEQETQLLTNIGFLLGIKIEANYKGCNKWYPGSIMGIHRNWTFDIHYDDGEIENGLPLDRIRTIPKATPQLPLPATAIEVSYQLDDKVEGNYHSRGKWYPGKISCIHADGCYDIVYNDGDSESGVPSNLIRSVDQVKEPQSTVNAKYQVQDKIEANYQNKGIWYKATIQVVKAPNDVYPHICYEILYDDATVEMRVPEILIRPISEPTWSPAPVTTDSVDPVADQQPEPEKSNSEVPTESEQEIELEYSIGSEVLSDYHGLGMWLLGKVDAYQPSTR
jgi:hypothetical protein